MRHLDVRTWLIALSIVLLAAGCGTDGGLITYTNPDTGESWEVINPPKSQAPAQLSRGSNGTIIATAGPPWREDTAVKQLWIVPVIGTGLIVLGVATLTLRSWFPSVPMAASVGAMATGALLIAAPKIVQEAWWMIALMVGAVVVMYGISWWDNRRKLKGAKT
ncbi:MAG: hypothetical protein GC159_12985 [Phycisphaera sp.]|nr:hypothetical protein [Phycisphaera sp.]